MVFLDHKMLSSGSSCRSCRMPVCPSALHRLCSKILHDDRDLFQTLRPAKSQVTPQISYLQLRTFDKNSLWGKLNIRKTESNVKKKTTHLKKIVKIIF